MVTNNEHRIIFEPDHYLGTKGLLSFYHGAILLHCHRLELTDAKKRREFTQEVVAIYPGLDKPSIERLLLDQVAGITAAKEKAAAAKAEQKDRDYLAETPVEFITKAKEDLRRPDLFEVISRDIEALGIAGESELALLLYIVMTSRKLDNPLSAIIQGASSSGKSFIIEKLAELIPAEAVLMAHDFTDQALYYLDEGLLRHKVVVSGERVNDRYDKDGKAQDNSKAFREMTASGVLRKATVVKGDNGKMKTEIIIQQGPIAYIESTTSPSLHDEDATRLLILSTDESQEQTERIGKALRDKARGKSMSKDIIQDVINKHHAIQRLLEPLTVRIPYADSLTLPTDKIISRRSITQLITAIQTVALFRQFQKIVHGEGEQRYIEADDKDYEIVYPILQKAISQKYITLNPLSQNLLKIICEQVNYDDTFTRRDCEKWTGNSTLAISRQIKPLEDEGYVQIINGTSKPYKYEVCYQEGDKFSPVIPEPEIISERCALMINDNEKCCSLSTVINDK